MAIEMTPDCGIHFYIDDNDKAFLEMEEKIKTLEAQVPRWISVDERLPKKLMRVLVFKQRNGHALWNVAMWDIEIDWRGESDWSKNPDNWWFTVTHWMPLPEPPKEENHE